MNKDPSFCLQRPKFLRFVVIQWNQTFFFQTCCGDIVRSIREGQIPLRVSTWMRWWYGFWFFCFFLFPGFFAGPQYFGIFGRNGFLLHGFYALQWDWQDGCGRDNLQCHSSSSLGFACVWPIRYFMVQDERLVCETLALWSCVNSENIEGCFEHIWNISK